MYGSPSYLSYGSSYGSNQLSGKAADLASLVPQWTPNNKSDSNAESLRVVQEKLKDAWMQEYPPTTDQNALNQFWSQVDMPNNYFFFGDVWDWSWDDVKNQLLLAKQQLAKHSAALPNTISAWNTVMLKHASTSEFAVGVPAAGQNNQNPPNGNGNGNGNGSDDPPAQGLPILPIVGVTVGLGLLVFLYLRSRPQNQPMLTRMR